jgi:hypothetical protein
MPTFPTLSSFKLTEDVIDSWEEGLVIDPTLRSEQEGGYELTRSRFTRDRRFWQYEFPYYTSADKATLMIFERTTVRVGTTSFTWINPLNSTSYTVRFGKPVDYKPNKGTPYWKIKIRMEEV